MSTGRRRGLQASGQLSAREHELGNVVLDYLCLHAYFGVVAVEDAWVKEYLIGLVDGVVAMVCVGA